MLEGKPLNNFVTLQGTVRIIIDGKIYSTHKGNLMEWRHKDRLKVRNTSNTFEIKNSTEPESVQHKEVVLSLKGRDEGTTKNHEPYLHLFYYQYDRPTDKEVREQILKLRSMFEDDKPADSAEKSAEAKEDVANR